MTRALHLVALLALALVPAAVHIFWLAPALVATGHRRLAVLSIAGCAVLVVIVARAWPRKAQP